jgi:hypothetical protein
MEKHVTFVGSLRIGLGALGLLAAMIVFTAVVGGGLMDTSCTFSRRML